MFVAPLIFEILEDCLIAERIEPLTDSPTRKRLTKTSKFLLFDLGVRRLAAKEGTRLPREKLGNLLEQFVGLELIRCARMANQLTKILFWRDPDGPEVDWVIQTPEVRIPVEVKWTDTPSVSDARHLRTFLEEYPQDQEGYVMCRTPRRVKLGDRLYAVPWQETDSLILA